MRLFTFKRKRKLERFARNYCAYVLFAFSLLGLLGINLSHSHSLSFNDDNENFDRRVTDDKAVMVKQNNSTQSGDRISAHNTPKNGVLRIDKFAKNPEKLYFYTNIIVHFDLKGAPPKLTYFLKLLDLVARSGATGVLIEWEDMFPWDGPLKNLRNTDAYSKEDVETILKKAKEHGLEVIPLVQTFGHLEWILKYEEYRKFRENDKYPQVICIGDPEAVELVKEAIGQVVRAHEQYGLKHFHIGADEAFEYGTCDASAKLVRSLGSLEKLAIRHLATVASYVKQISKGTTILAWHDMLRNFAESDLVAEGLGKLIQPVIWDYSETLQVESSLVESLTQNFGQIWASSAFKGADSPDTKYSRFEHYRQNNIHWVSFQQDLRTKSPPYSIQGIIITGWSRFDHMAGLCEIWPVAEPSMILNVQIALIGAHRAYKDLALDEISKKAHQSTLQVLDCETNWMMSGCNFPGVDFYEAFQQLYRDVSNDAEHALKKNYQIKGWLTEYNIRHGISQNWYLNQIRFMLESHRIPVEKAANRVRKEMLKLFHNSTVDEFFFEHIDPLMRKIDHYLSVIAKLEKIDVQQKRHFKIQSYNSSSTLISQSGLLF